MTTDELAAFAAADLDRLLCGAGLPAGIPVRQVADAWGAAPDAYARYVLGDPPREAFWCVARLPAYREGVRLWFDGDDTLLKIEGEWPDLRADRLPAPTTTRELSDRSLELLWPEHGVAVATDGAPDGAVLRLALFPPMTAADYERGLAPVLESRECE